MYSIARFLPIAVKILLKGVHISGNICDEWHYLSVIQRQLGAYTGSNIASFLEMLRLIGGGDTNQPYTSNQGCGSGS